MLTHNQINMIQQDNKQKIDFFLQNSVFMYEEYENTIFVPVYPRAYVQEIIGIDYDRRTVTAHFVLHVTICCKVVNQELRKFIRSHLILQFGYSQTIYIPEILKLDNPFCIITQVIQPGNNDDYVTYKIRGNFECSAHFDLMLFPFRQIEVNNHLVFRSQTFKEYQIKYNAMMMLDQQNALSFYQFSPHITFPEFAGYRIKHFSTEMATAQSKYQMKKGQYRDDLLGYLKNMIYSDHKKIQVPDQTKPQEMALFLLKLQLQQLEKTKNQNQEKKKDQQLSPFKHVLFKFEMISLKPAFVFQNEVPIWILSVLALYTFTSRPDIGNRYGNIVLLIVSFVSLFTNFRVNNVGHSSFTFYEIKLIIILFVPVLLIISTVLDYYSDTDQSKTSYSKRQSQIQNPFMLASLIIVLVSFFTTMLFLMFIAITKYIRYFSTGNKANRNESQSMWQKLIGLQWKQPMLMRKIIDLSKGKPVIPFKIMDDEIRLNIIQYKMKKSRDPPASRFVQAILSKGKVQSHKPIH